MSQTSTPEVQLDSILTGGQLPALPQSAIRILELSQDPDNGPAEFAVPIESDPGLAGQVLRFVNSSYFGFSREISSVKLAITLVGIRTIKNFTLWSAVFSLMPNPKCGPLDLKLLWQDSLRRALLARRMGLLAGLKEADDLFAAALLQDMAVPLLSKEFAQQYTEFFEKRQDGAARLSELEQETFGWTHAEAAARLAVHWNLPEELVEPIRRHTEAADVFADSGSTLSERCVSLSALLPPSVDNKWPERETFETLYEQVRPSDGPTVLELFERVDTEFVDFAPVLQISTPTRTLADCYREATDEAGDASDA